MCWLRRKESLFLAHTGQAFGPTVALALALPFALVALIACGHVAVAPTRHALVTHLHAPLVILGLPILLAVIRSVGVAGIRVLQKNVRGELAV